MNFEKEFGKGIMKDEEKIVEAVQNLLGSEIEQINIARKQQAKTYDVSTSLPIKGYESEDSDASNINLFQAKISLYLRTQP